MARVYICSCQYGVSYKIIEAIVINVLMYLLSKHRGSNQNLTEPSHYCVSFYSYESSKTAIKTVLLVMGDSMPQLNPLTNDIINKIANSKKLSDNIESSHDAVRLQVNRLKSTFSSQPYENVFITK